MNGCKHLVGRVRQRSSIQSSGLSDCVGSSVRRSSSCAATSLTNDHSISKRRRWSSTTQSIPPNNINWYNKIQQQRRLQCFSSSTTDDDTEVAGEDELKLISINDHLDELQHIPLEDVRNFCIIAHVVRFTVVIMYHQDYTMTDCAYLGNSWYADDYTFLCTSCVLLLLSLTHILLLLQHTQYNTT